MMSAPSLSALSSRRTSSCSESAPAASKSLVTRTEHTGAMQRATPAMNVPWPAYGGISAPFFPGGGSSSHWPVTPASHGWLDALLSSPVSDT
jgi:hypothetical protein